MAEPLAPQRLTDFLERVVTYHRRHPQQRLGQALFNVLHEERPNLANAIRGSSLDPFHRDAFPVDTLIWIEHRFREEVRPADA